MVKRLKTVSTVIRRSFSSQNKLQIRRIRSKFTPVLHAVLLLVPEVQVFQNDERRQRCGEGRGAVGTDGVSAVWAETRSRASRTDQVDGHSRSCFMRLKAWGFSRDGRIGLGLTPDARRSVLNNDQRATPLPLGHSARTLCSYFNK